MNKKFFKTTLLRTSTNVGGAKRIRIWNRNLQTKITVFLCARRLLLVHRKAVFKLFFFIFTPLNLPNAGILHEKEYRTAKSPPPSASAKVKLQNLICYREDGMLSWKWFFKITYNCWEKGYFSLEKLKPREWKFEFHLNHIQGPLRLVVKI